MHSNIENNTDIRSTYVGLSRFLYEDYGEKYSADVRQHKSKCDALEIMRRNEGLRRLITEAFPESLRLSVHRHPESPHLLGVNLIPQQEGTPWHHAPVIHKDKTVSMMKRKDAERLGFELFYKDGRPLGFIER